MLESQDGETRSNTYTPYGTSTAPDPGNPFRYCSEYLDAETGFYYLRARYYSPETARFVSEDPARDGWNWYTYALNDPVNFADPSGEIAVAVAAAIVAAAIGGAVITYAELVRVGNRLNIPSNILRRVYSMLAPLAAKRGNDNKSKSQGSSAKAYPKGQAEAASPMPPNGSNRGNGDNRGNGSNKNLQGNNSDSNSLRKISGNKEANNVARRNGYPNAEALKRDYVQNAGSKFNIMRNTRTGELVLQSINGNIKIPTGLYM